MSALEIAVAITGIWVAVAVGTLFLLLLGTGRLRRRPLQRNVDPLTAEALAEFHRQVDEYLAAKQ